MLDRRGHASGRALAGCPSLSRQKKVEPAHRLIYPDFRFATVMLNQPPYRSLTRGNSANLLIEILLYLYQERQQLEYGTLFYRGNFVTICSPKTKIVSVSCESNIERTEQKKETLLAERRSKGTTLRDVLVLQKYYILSQNTIPFIIQRDQIEKINIYVQTVLIYTSV